jgi:hypothetical protein
MARFHQITLLITVVAALAALTAGSASALTLLSPTEDQVVREKVKITLPASALPPDFVPRHDAPVGSRSFVAVYVENAGTEQLVAAFSPDAATFGNGRVTFYWDSKAPYRDVNSPKVDKFYKDGRYKVRVQVHDSAGKLVDSATVNVELKNKVPRPNPAPAVRLVNRLALGGSNTFKAHADVQVFEVVSGVGLPILGGMGLTSDFRIIQSVEDVRPSGEYMLRYRMDPKGFISAYGTKMPLYPADQPKPQLYRLVDRYGNVINRNIFSKQGIYTIMDVLPALPSRPVKEGDSWPTTFDLKIEGITGIIPLTGTSMLDSFEWQNGHECAKIISSLNGSSVIRLNNNKIVSRSDKVDVQMVTYFAYKIGKMLRREVKLDFDAHIMPGAEQFESDSSAATSTPSPMPSPMVPNYGTGFEDEMDGGPMPGPSRLPYGKSSSGDKFGAESGVKKGSVQINLVVTLEK